MKTRIKNNIYILFLSVGFLGFSQKKLADKFFESYSYIKASEFYELAIKKGDSSLHTLTRAGDCYWNNSNPENAAIWYREALNKYPKIDNEYVFKYIQTQLALENYEEAGKWIGIYKESESKNKDENLFVADLEAYKALSSTKKVYVEMENLDVNSKFSDFGAYEHNDILYFSSARNSTKKIYDWTQESFLDIYESKIQGQKILAPELISANAINTSYHESSIAITNNDSIFYFTRVNLNKKEKLNPDNVGTVRLMLYKATLDKNGKWNTIEKLPFNTETSSTGHPTLSPDNKRLYFVSDREGGYGQTDIYYVDITESGYGQPTNLGPDVNTNGREVFPFISKNGTLYFSSDGYANIGLLDIYETNYLNDKKAKVINLELPFNSGHDDFAFFINDDLKTGYLSSNRPEGKGNDDIYRFKKYECEQLIQGVVINSDTEAPITEAIVQVINKNGKIIKEQLTLENGKFEFTVPCEATFTVLGKKKDFKDDFKNVITDNENSKIHDVELRLDPLIKEGQIVINPIFFNFDKWDIRTDAQYELEHIVDVLRAHPTMVIKIESHTDSRGGDNYNMSLSDRRAKSTRDYLVSRGISSNRIESAIGYGESQLLNKCSNGVKCTKEEHQLNRRSYFYILKY